jgi:hypothetical protein
MCCIKSEQLCYCSSVCVVIHPGGVAFHKSGEVQLFRNDTEKEYYIHEEIKNRHLG